MTFRAAPGFWEERAPLIGTQPDRTLAELWGVPVSQVVTQRRKLRLPPVPYVYADAPAQWSDEQLAMLGTMPDTEIAKAMGDIAPDVVQAQRVARGILSFADQVYAGNRQELNGQYLVRKWPPELLAELGKRSDSFLAKYHDIPEQFVTRKRIALGLKEQPLSHLHPVAPMSLSSFPAQIYITQIIEEAIGRGSHILITGRNGSGKTALANTLASMGRYRPLEDLSMGPLVASKFVDCLNGTHTPGKPACIIEIGACDASAAISKLNAVLRKANHRFPEWAAVGMNSPSFPGLLLLVLDTLTHGIMQARLLK